MATNNFKLFDENKANIMSDTEYGVNPQRLNGVQTGVASSQLNNKFAYQMSLIAYSIAQMMNANGIDANDTQAVSAFVNGLSSTVMQKVLDKATEEMAIAGTDTSHYMTPALIKKAIGGALKLETVLIGTLTSVNTVNNALPVNFNFDNCFSILIVLKEVVYNTSPFSIYIAKNNTNNDRILISDSQINRPNGNCIFNLPICYTDEKGIKYYTPYQSGITEINCFLLDAYNKMYIDTMTSGEILFYLIKYVDE